MPYVLRMLIGEIEILFSALPPLHNSSLKPGKLSLI
jgi:hypothetical protein